MICYSGSIGFTSTWLHLNKTSWQIMTLEICPNVRSFWSLVQNKHFFTVISNHGQVTVTPHSSSSFFFFLKKKFCCFIFFLGANCKRFVAYLCASVFMGTGDLLANLYPQLVVDRCDHNLFISVSNLIAFLKLPVLTTTISLHGFSPVYGSTHTDRQRENFE